MARPRKINLTEQDMARDTAPEIRAEGLVQAPVEPVYTPPPAPRRLRIERQGGATVPVTTRYPQVRGGVCDFCGVIDPNVPSEFQYQLCPHYRGMHLRCSYCAETVNPDEINYKTLLNVAGHPSNPELLIVWCNLTECQKKHRERFQVSA